jgi:DNA polymerase-4
VVANRDPRSIGHEETFANDRHGRSELQTDLVRLADSVAGRLRKAQLCARTVSIKVRFSDFTTITRALTLTEPVDDGPAILRTAGELLDQVELSVGVRLLGVSGSNLVAGGRQLTLDYGSGSASVGASCSASVGASGSANGSATSAAIDEIRGRFGDSAIAPASLVDFWVLRVHRRGMQQWGPSPSSTGSNPPMETNTPRVVADGDV